MEKSIIIDNRMREIEKNKLKNLGYTLIEIPTSEEVYPEISSHVDIFACKVADKIIIDPTQYIYMPQTDVFIEGRDNVEAEYPFDIKYNVCTIGKKAIHNFKYTDTVLQQHLIKAGYELINTTQGYTNCSIAVIDDNSAIVSDSGLYQILKAHNIDTLLVNNDLDIKLLNKNQYSNKKGFIGGCISQIDDKIIVFGDLSKIDENSKIEKFIKSKGKQIIDFTGLDVMDYGGIIEF